MKLFHLFQCWFSSFISKVLDTLLQAICYNKLHSMLHLFDVHPFIKLAHDYCNHFGFLLGIRHPLEYKICLQRMEYNLHKLSIGCGCSSSLLSLWSLLFSLTDWSWNGSFSCRSCPFERWSTPVSFGLTSSVSMTWSSSSASHFPSSSLLLFRIWLLHSHKWPFHGHFHWNNHRNYNNPLLQYKPSQKEYGRILCRA